MILLYTDHLLFYLGTFYEPLTIYGTRIGRGIANPGRQTFILVPALTDLYERNCIMRRVEL